MKHKLKDPGSAITHLIGMILAAIVSIPLIIKSFLSGDYVRIIAILGIVFKMFWVTCPKWVSSIMYIAMGWLCIVAIAPIIHSLSKTSFGWLLAGGIIYTVGGVIYALKIPWFENHWKNFGLHEIFHLFVMGGSLCHMILMFQI